MPRKPAPIKKRRVKQGEKFAPERHAERRRTEPFLSGFITVPGEKRQVAFFSPKKRIRGIKNEKANGLTWIGVAGEDARRNLIDLYSDRREQLHIYKKFRKKKNN